MTSPLLKIAIVGAGISGLSTYLFLKKHLSSILPHEIHIFESYPSPTRQEREFSNEGANAREAASFIGGGLGVAPNGMRVLKAMDPEIHDAVMAQGYPTLRFQIKNSRNWTLGSMPTTDISEESSEVMVMSTRQGVWDCLRDKVPGKVLQTGKTIAKLDRGPNLKPILEFTDGSKTDEFDLVIGADGVKSIVKASILESERFTPTYEGVCGVGGFVPSSYLQPIPPSHNLPAPQSPVVMTFGADGFFGYGPCSVSPNNSPSTNILTTTSIKTNTALPYGPHAMWWSTFSTAEPSSHSDSKAPDPEAIHAQLLARHSKWQDPFIQKVLASAPPISVTTATYTTPKLPTWTSPDGAIVLLGDAAHCLPSTSGQGVSQALEDAQTLALLLSHHLQQPVNSEEPLSASATTATATTHSDRAPQIRTATTTFQHLRKPRVEKILDYSRRMGNRKKKMGPVGEWTTYAMMWAMCLVMSGLKPRFPGGWDGRKEVERVVGAKVGGEKGV